MSMALYTIGSASSPFSFKPCFNVLKYCSSTSRLPKRRVLLLLFLKVSFARLLQFATQSPAFFFFFYVKTVKSLYSAIVYSSQTNQRCFLKIFQIHKRHYQLFDFSIFVKSPISTVYTIAHTT